MYIDTIYVQRGNVQRSINKRKIKSQSNHNPNFAFNLVLIWTKNLVKILNLKIDRLTLVGMLIASAQQSK